MNNSSAVCIYKFLGWLVFFLFCGVALQGQTQPIFQRLDSSNGLSSARITGIAKEKGGFVWISTQYGLNRYDGHSVKVYTKQNSQLPTNDIAGLYLDRQNRLWITTLGRGLVLYDAAKDDFITYKQDDDNPHSIASNRINAVLEDASGVLWVGTEKGISVFDAVSNQFTNYSTSHPHQLNVLSLFEDSQGRMWLGTASSGIFLFHKQTKQFVEVHKTPSVAINAITELNAHQILFASTGEGMVLHDVNENKLVPFLADQEEFAAKTKIVRSLLNDTQGNLWIGSDGFGLFELQNWNTAAISVKNYMQNTQQAYALSGNAIYALTEDEEENLWIGTAWNGVNILDINRQTELIFSDFTGVEASPVLSIFQNEQYLFLGLDGQGLSMYNNQTNETTFLNEQKLLGKYIQKIIQTKDGNIWLGTFSNGLLKLDLKTKKVKQFVHTNDSNSISFNDVRDIVEDEYQNLWIATWGGGLNYLNTQTEKFSRYDVGHNNLISLLEDGKDLWITSYGGGLRFLNTHTKQLKTFLFDENNTHTVSSNNIFTVLKDSSGYLWIATSGEGINRMDLTTHTIERFENNDNIRYQTINSIIEDDEHNLWFGSKNGIIKYDFTRDNFSISSNLQGDYHINSVAKDTAGFLYFGGIKGVMRFNPTLLKNSSQHPKVVFTDFKIFNKAAPTKEEEARLTLAQEVELKHHEDVITFEFAALKFPFSSHCEYAIQMENFDSDWRTIGTDRTVTYTNLYPGEYTFKVKSKVVGAEWEEAYTTKKITILKPFWLTWWAFGLYILLFLGFLYGFRKISLSYATLKNNLALEKLTHQKDNELYQLKQQFFTRISHEIRTPVTLILSSINRLFEEDKLNASKPLKAAHTIRRNSNLLLRLVNELLDTRKLEANQVQLKVAKHELVSFLKEVFLSFSEVASDRTIHYQFKTDVTFQYLWFDKAQLEKVVFNLLSNAFKFTPDEGSILLHMKTTEHEVILQVKDSGVGIPNLHRPKIFDKFYQVNNGNEDTNKGFGLGLAIAKEVVELHKGSISVHSNGKKGSVFEVILLKGHAHLDGIENTTKNQEENTERIQHLKDKIAKKTTPKPSLLIVEDHLEIQESLRDLLEDEYFIYQAFNGVEGLQKAVLHLPDMVITDLMMPEMQGDELVKKLKQNSLTSAIPIIVLTAKTTLEDQLESFEKGADEYIMKPYNEGFLKKRIATLLQNRKRLQQNFSESTPTNPKQIKATSQDQQFLENLYKVLEEHLQSENLKAEDIAQHLNISVSTLSKKVKNHTGLTYQELVKDYRLSVAKQLIQEMGYNVSDACYKVGYSDRKYFSKLFKQKFGKNPSEFL